MHGTAPLAPSYEFVLEDKMRAVQAALNALSILTDGEIHIAINHRKKHSIFKDLHYVNIHKVSGPHPSGNVSTLISKIDPINKGEVVWTIQPQDLVIIGELFLSGKYQAEKTIAITGAMVKEPCYYTTKIGASLETLLKGKLTGANARVISGNVLTGNNEGIKGSLRHYHDAITVIPEGDDYEIFGWLKPVANKVSITRSFTFSWLFPKRKFNLNTNTNGEERAFVITGHYEKVFPLDIYPMQLLKSCLYEDLDEMESIGMYEVAPEDFALTEFVCISKQPHQEIVRKGLDLMLKEIG
jgi:Na+-transporting NADH:ubiquinone oxidoreductase subunit A